ncbi:MAG: hypothetical protein EBT43_05095, partial [Methylocystaceae bacterium]|nr:hypothetical protein [Methylocystaceae bacterium]
MLAHICNFLNISQRSSKRKNLMRKLYLSSISLLALSIAIPACAQQSLPTIEIGATPLRAQSRAPSRAIAAPSRIAGGARPTAQSTSNAGIGAQTPYVSPLVT